MGFAMARRLIDAGPLTSLSADRKSENGIIAREEQHYSQRV
jgi:hypothetical protein